MVNMSISHKDRLSDIAEQMTIVIVGHVDHGKSTVIGRLLADTNSLPEGKLEQVRQTCQRTAKPFEYAFLLDALKDEQAQGITIDSARVFFKTDQRRYIIFDAPGHIEFLKNMVTGAAHAQAALLVIDAHEGIKENSRRHGYLLSMLGVRQISVVVNKMDLVGWQENAFTALVKEYDRFLSDIRIKPASYIPISAFCGDNLSSHSSQMPWYKGPTVLEQLDAFKAPVSLTDLPFRFPVQDIYKFTAQGDERRIIAGTAESGAVNAGNNVVFLPSEKRAKVVSVEEFNRPSSRTARAGQSIGFTLDTQLYIKPGEVMVRQDDPFPQVSTRFKANLFWLGRVPLTMNKKYRLKLATARVSAQIVEIRTVIDAAELSASSTRDHVDTNEVAEIVIETDKPIAFDMAGGVDALARFVLVDNYEISGGGIVTECLETSNEALNDHVRQREFAWVKGGVNATERCNYFGHKAAFVLMSGPTDTGKIAAATALEAALVCAGKKAYYLGISNLLCGLDKDLLKQYEDKEEHLRRLGELARIMTDAGLIFIATASDIDGYDIARLRALASPAQTFVIHFGGEAPDNVSCDAVFQQKSSAEEVSLCVKGLLTRARIINA